MPVARGLPLKAASLGAGGISVAEAGRQVGVSERTALNYVIRAMVKCRSHLDQNRGDRGNDKP